MGITLSRPITATKLFVGYLIAKNLSEKLDLSKSDESIEKVYFKGKDYIGAFIDEKEQTLRQIQDVKEKIDRQLKIIAPELELKDMNVYVFPQIFLS